MGIDVSKYKVIHSDKVYNALVIMNVEMPEWKSSRPEQFTKPKFIEVLVINEDGNIMEIYDEAWTFQFIPRVTKE